MKLYPIADRLTFAEREHFGIKGVCHLAGLGWSTDKVKAIYTGEKRCPKAGEWYLSGAIVGAYRASHDLSTSYHIARLVKVETRTVTTLSLYESRRESSLLTYSVGE